MIWVGLSGVLHPAFVRVGHQRFIIMMDYKFGMIAILSPLLSACVAQFDNDLTNCSLRLLIAISHWRFIRHEGDDLKDHLKVVEGVD